jgi:hypothetical protein
MVHDKGGLGGSICMYSVISKTTVLFVCEVHALSIFGLSVAPRHRAKKCVIFSRANIFCVRIFFATSLLHFLKPKPKMGVLSPQSSELSIP